MTETTASIGDQSAHIVRLRERIIGAFQTQGYRTSLEAALMRMPDDIRMFWKPEDIVNRETLIEIIGFGLGSQDQNDRVLAIKGLQLMMEHDHQVRNQK